MKKYRINWLTVFRNVVVIFFISSCMMATHQIEAQEKKMELLDEEIQMELMKAKHGLKSRVNHRGYSYTPLLEKTSENTISQETNGKIHLGKYKITHYCACKKCCGPNAQGITASGKKVEEGVTIAVDPKVIKLGSKVKIDGYGTYEAQDTGSAIKGNKIDVYIADHQRALQMGVVYKDVWLIR